MTTSSVLESPALSVAGATIEDVSTALVSPGFVGRVPELAEARRRAGGCGGRPVTVLIGGEAGVGKTRLIREFAERPAKDGARVVVGQCVELGEDGLPFAPIAAALRDLADQLGSEALLEFAGPGRDMLPSLVPELGVGTNRVEEGRGRLFEVVAGRGVAGPAPHTCCYRIVAECHDPWGTVLW